MNRIGPRTMAAGPAGWWLATLGLACCLAEPAALAQPSDNRENNRNDIAECAKFFREQVAALAAAAPCQDPLYVGWAAADITPPRPVASVGQLHKCSSTGVRDSLTVTCLALETRGPDGQREQARMISADLIMIQRAVVNVACPSQETENLITFRHEVVVADLPAQQPVVQPFYETDSPRHNENAS